MRRRAKSRLETYVGSVPLRRPSDLLYARWVRELGEYEGRIEAQESKLSILLGRIVANRKTATILRRKIERAEEDRARENLIETTEAASELAADASGELSQDCEDEACACHDAHGADHD